MTTRRITVTVTTAADGTATVYSPVLSGALHTIRYVATDFASTADFTITAEETGQSIATASNVAASFTQAPRQPVSAPDSTAYEYTTGFPVVDHIVIGSERIKIVVAQGGASKTGTFHFLLTEMALTSLA